MEGTTGSRRFYYVSEAGNTGGAHQEWLDRIQRRGFIEVSSPEQSDYLLVFCPVVSRVGTDIQEALKNSPGGKPTILIVMHHTFNRDLVVGQSEKQVNDPNVCLTVDTLFYRGEFLQCHCNSTAWDQILTCLGLPTFEVLLVNPLNKWWSVKHWLAFFVSLWHLFLWLLLLLWEKGAHIISLCISGPSAFVNYCWLVCTSLLKLCFDFCVSVALWILRNVAGLEMEN